VSAEVYDRATSYEEDPVFAKTLSQPTAITPHAPDVTEDAVLDVAEEEMNSHAKPKMPLPRVGSAVLVVDDDRLLLGVRGKAPHEGRWVLPGGGVRAFETIGAAARRELREETGLDIELDGTLDIVEIIDPPHEHRVIVYSRGRPVGGTVRASSDLIDVRFVPRREVKDLDLTPAVRALLERHGWV
jgi:8-oxo-dGTP diphosphatase